MAVVNVSISKELIKQSNRKSNKKVALFRKAKVAEEICGN